MIFYSFSAWYNNFSFFIHDEGSSFVSNRKRARMIQRKTEEVCTRQIDKARFFISEIDFDGPASSDPEDSFCYANVSGGILVFDEKNVVEKLTSFLREFGEFSPDIQIEEVTLRDFSNILRMAFRENYMESEDAFFKKLKMDYCIDSAQYRYLSYDEELLNLNPKKQIVEEAKLSMYADSLVPEIKRIYSGGGKAKKHFGIPVHYLITMNHEDTRLTACYQSLLSSLYDNGRLKNKRYIIMDAVPNERVSMYQYETLYQMSFGGALILKIKMMSEEETGKFASMNRDLISGLSTLCKKYHSDVLTIFCVESSCSFVKPWIFDGVGNLALVDITEGVAKGDKSYRILRSLCREKEIYPDKSLYDMIDLNQSYSADELSDIFHAWYQRKMRNTFFPQYKNLAIQVGENMEKRGKGSAYNELMELIGLENGKKVINQFLNYFKATRVLKEKGFKADTPTMALAFHGAPGTCKTTVARLIAEILYDEGILTTDKMFECSKADLVASYVGQTSGRVEHLFKQAVGGCLFIDEIYDLAEKDTGGFSAEAVNMITECLELYRDKILFICAGYSDRMKSFFDMNPGLLSRIPFHVYFDNYSVDQLCSISQMIAKKKGLVISPKAMEKLHTIYEDVSKQPDFGNGRAVRNILESAKMSMATRLMEGDYSLLTREQAITILPEDITMPSLITKQPIKTAIGF